MRVLVTGGAGYIGFNLCLNLLDLNVVKEVIIYDNLTRKNINIFFDKRFLNRPISFVEGDILDNRKLKRACVGIDLIIHLAGKVSSPNRAEDFHLFDYVNNWGTSNIVEQANYHRIPKLIYLSSLSVYGNNYIPNNKPNPSNDYARSKFNGEKHLMTLHGSCDYHIVRSGNTFGYNPSIRLDTVINKFAFRAKYNQKLLINGNGEQKHSFIHINRLTKQLCWLVENNYSKKVIDLSDHILSINHIVSELNELEPNLEYAFIDVEHQHFSQEFIGQVLPYNSSFSFELEHFYSRFSF